MKRKKHKSFIILHLLLILFFILTGVLLLGLFTDRASSNDVKYISPTPSPIIALPTEPVLSEFRTLDQLNSPNAILLQLNDNTLLYEKNSKDRIYPASLTKIMTAILCLDHLQDLKKEIFLSPEIFQPLYDAGASMAGFLPGESVPAIDLIYGVLLPSGAECCIGLANDIAGSEEAFVSLMNQKAEELGMEQTHFRNSTGLHDPDHYTTVEDLSILLQYALQSDTFRDIFTAKKHSTAATDLHPGGISFYSTLFKNRTASLNGGEILGGKTGYTSEAGLCLASLARINDMEYILITAGAWGDHNTEQYNISDAIMVYNELGKR